MDSRSVLTLILISCVLQQAEAHGTYHDLLAKLNAELAQRQDDPAVLLQRARLHVSHDDWSSALIDLELVDRLRPDSTLTDGVRGEALNICGKWHAAIAALDVHLNAHPTDADALFERGKAYKSLGRGNEALADFRRYLANTTDVTSEKVLLIAGAVEAAEGPRAAMHLLENLLPQLSHDPGVTEKAFALAVASDSTDSALRHLQMIQDKAPRPEPWMARRAEVLSKAGRTKEASAAWVALRTHLLQLPNLERGTPLLQDLLTKAETALGHSHPETVIAPPAPSPPKP